MEAIWQKQSEANFMRLTTEQVETLCKTIVKSFSEDDFQRLLRIKLDKSWTKSVPMNKSYEDKVPLLVEKFEESETTSDLIQAILTARPDQKSVQDPLSKILASLRAEATTGPEQIDKVNKGVQKVKEGMSLGEVEAVLHRDPTISLPAADRMKAAGPAHLSELVDRLSGLHTVSRFSARTVLQHFAQQSASLMVDKILQAESNWHNATGTAECFTIAHRPHAAYKLATELEQTINPDVGRTPASKHSAVWQRQTGASSFLKKWPARRAHFAALTNITMRNTFTLSSRR